MTTSMLRGVRRSFALLAAGTALATGGAAAAQSGVPAGAVVQPLPRGDEGAELRRHLADLAANPRSVSSLIGAGRAALRVGDGDAALGFFARAEEIAPGDARVKAGMASAFVLTGRSEAALRYFADAARLGAPEAEIARDRGLAFDMSGNPRRAQQDYALVLQRGDDAETRRRMALSLAISGHRDAALRAIDPLLRRRDTAAYRTRAFVLALTGDANGAAQAVDAAMPGQGAAMSPFLSRLAGLNPAQKAMAVHFGHFPADGRPVQMAQAVDTSAHPAAVALTGAAPAAPAASRQTGQPAQPVTRRRTALAEPLNRDRRRPATDDLDRSGRVGPGSRGGDSRRSSSEVRVAASTPVRAPQQTAQRQPAPQQQQSRSATPAPQPGFSTAPAQAQARQPVQVARAQPLEIPPAMRQDPAPEPAARQAPAPTVATPAPASTRSASEPAPAFVPPAAAPNAASTAPAATAPAPTSTAPAQAASARAETEAALAQSAPAPAFSDIAALVQSLPAEEEARASAARETPRTAAPAARTATTPARASTTPARTTSAPATRTAAAGRTATPAASGRTAARTPAPPAHPARHWVQIANGAPGALAFELGRIRRTAPELMQGRTAWSAANGASGRLLIGPFETTAAARAFINQLARKDVEAFPWSSRAGEEVARLPAR